ncbi:MAG: HypC/HybG/HupF family hydrogenase formation chaperone [bacterium]|nr:HypC/HybG/HupF family hydrogenase formation chaperone [bacterium]
MCLGVPGKVVSIEENPLGMNMGRVSFGGIVKEVCLAYTPEAEIGDYVVVHVGFAISKIDEDEAAKVFEYLREMDELGELEVPQPGEVPGDETRGGAA